MKAIHLAITLACLSLALPAVAAMNDAASSAVATNVDRLLKARGKVNAAPLIAAIVSLGDAAVPVLTNRLESATNRMAVHWAMVCLCRINSDNALKPVRNMLQDTSHAMQLSTANQSPPESEVALWCLRLTTAIREYPTNREADILPDLIRLSDPAFGGMVHYYATERLREMVRRQPSVAGVIIDALDDRPEREHFSWNLGEILANESGHANRWGIFGGSSDPKTIVARRNSIWRDWWTRNKDRTVAEWKAEAQVIPATNPKMNAPTNAPSLKP